MLQTSVKPNFGSCALGVVHDMFIVFTIDIENLDRASNVFISSILNAHGNVMFREYHNG